QPPAMIVPLMPGPSKVPPVIGMMLRLPSGVSPTGIAGPSVTISSKANSRRGACGSSCDQTGEAPSATVAARTNAEIAVRFIRKPLPLDTPSNRQADVVFRDAGLRGAARGDIVELGDLHRVLERTVVGEPVHQARQRPRKPFGLPHPRQRLVGIAGDRVVLAAPEEGGQ